ncbi:MAG: TusE/DsrC/DsvC family sulfur relay protein [Deltaproteobacteria bacterium]|nr:MAG: TusE/DsrC/DsvC family sulfur relay protein [Deltaproteobacteria bacterium]
MRTLEYEDMKIEVDDEGYLLNADAWNEKVACALTLTVENVDACDLTEERMEILKFMRQYYNRFESFPIVRQVCKNVHQANECLYEEFIDPIQAWKIAGLPKPTPDAIARIRHEL